MSEILEQLNQEQRSAVECIDGPVLIVAGAGSGKTRVLTSRIAYMIEKGVDPSRIMALTFTKKAAGEMKERIARMVGEKKARHLWMGTFHSVFVRLLREFSDSIGYPSSFTIYDTSDSVSAIRTCIKQLGLDDKTYKPKDVLARISKAKNALVTADAYPNNHRAMEDDRIAKRPRLAELYKCYDTLLRSSGVMDFDDILLNMNILLKVNPAALKEIAGRFDHILVDEYQDTNFAQYRILRELMKDRPVHNLCVVGDDSQSIYAFRGARIENILNFQKDFPETKVFRLETNYRSTKNIVNAANSLISKNEDRLPKHCVAVGGEGEKLRLIRAYTAEEEAVLITSSILSRIREAGAEYRDFAILYRTNSQSRALEEALRKRNVPYMIYSGNSFFERAEIKDMMAYLKLTVNNSDNESFKRIVNTPARGIGATSLSALEAAAAKNGISLLEAAYRSDLESFGLRASAVQKIREFCDMIRRHGEMSLSQNADAVVKSLSDACGLYRSFKEDNSVEAQSRAANIEELVSSVTGFVEDRNGEYIEALIEDGAIQDADSVSEIECPLVPLGDFLEDISLLSNVDVVEDSDGDNRVALMTAHSAKGLEFPYVYVAGMEENLFPSGGMLASEKDIEEERRLFYVAITRAKTAVALTFANSRMRNGKHESNAPSRFLREIAPQYIENPLRKDDLRSRDTEEDDIPGFRFGSGNYRPYGAKSSSTAASGPRSFTPSSSASRPFTASSSGAIRSNAPMSTVKDALSRRTLPPKNEDFVPETMDCFHTGDRIEHNRFGFGRILEITGNIPELKARIVFDNYGEKLLLLKYAKIRRASLG